MTSPRDLRLLAGAVLLSSAGDLMAIVVLTLQVHALTGSGLAVSALLATTMVPVIVLAPVAGVLTDRLGGVRVLAWASVGQAVVAVGLAFAHADLATLLVLSALLSAGSTLAQPAEFTLVPRIVAGDRALVRANGRLEAARYAGFALGPLAAALLSGGAGARGALLLNALSFLVIAGVAVALRVPRTADAVPRSGDDRPRAREGVELLWRDAVLRPTVLAATGGLLFMSMSLTADVFYVKDVLGAGDAGYAAVYGAWMVGMVVGATAVATRVPRRALAAGALVALGVQGAAVAALTAWAIVPVALAGFAVGGLGHGTKNTLVRTLVQRRVPARAHGRAFAAYNAARNTAELAALAAAGVLVAAVGARDALIVAGLGPVLAAAAGLVALRRRRELGAGVGAEAAAPAPA